MSLKKLLNLSHDIVHHDSNAIVWSENEKSIFRVFFIYVLFLCLPLSPKFYEYLINIDWATFDCRDLFVVATARHLDLISIANESGRWGAAGYLELLLPLILSIPIAWIWGQFECNNANYNKLNYWIRAIARYRLGIGLVAWGYRKLLPGQMVLPTIGVLNTPMGDFQAQKLYWQAVGITPGYEVFLGFAEFIAGFLLLFRRTTTLGSALGFVVLLNIVIANHVYDGGVHLHSFYYVILSLFILWPDVPKIWNLIHNETNSQLKRFYPVITNNWLKYLRISLKFITFSVFVVLFFFMQVADYVFTPYRIPDTPGLQGATGYYKVSEFKLNGEDIPYSPLDSLRWQDAIFEKWSTLNFKVNRLASIDQSNGGGHSEDDFDRKWEVAGMGGGRRSYYYEADTIKKILHLRNKNEGHTHEKQILHYSRPDENRIILTGINEFNDSIYVVLDRQKRQYQFENHYAKQ